MQYQDKTITVTVPVDRDGAKLVYRPSNDESRSSYHWVLYFTVVGCTGNVWVSPFAGHLGTLVPTPQSSMVPSWEEVAIIPDPFALGGPDPDAHMIFIMDYSQLVLDPFTRSHMKNGVCIDDNTINPGYALPVTEAQFTDDRDDFHILFPPPYRICAADDFKCISEP